MIKKIKINIYIKNIIKKDDDLIFQAYNDFFRLCNKYENLILVVGYMNELKNYMKITCIFYIYLPFICKSFNIFLSDLNSSLSKYFNSEVLVRRIKKKVSIFNKKNNFYISYYNNNIYNNIYRFKYHYIYSNKEITFKNILLLYYNLLHKSNKLFLSLNNNNIVKVINYEVDGINYIYIDNLYSIDFFIENQLLVEFFNDIYRLFYYFYNKNELNILFINLFSNNKFINKIKKILLTLPQLNKNILYFILFNDGLFFIKNGLFISRDDKLLKELSLSFNLILIKKYNLSFNELKLNKSTILNKILLKFKKKEIYIISYIIYEVIIKYKLHNLYFNELYFYVLKLLELENIDKEDDLCFLIMAILFCLFNNKFDDFEDFSLEYVFPFYIEDKNNFNLIKLELPYILIFISYNIQILNNKLNYNNEVDLNNFLNEEYFYYNNKIIDNILFIKEQKFSFFNKLKNKIKKFLKRIVRLNLNTIFRKAFSFFKYNNKKDFENKILFIIRRSSIFIIFCLFGLFVELIYELFFK